MSTITSPLCCRSRAAGVNPRKKRRAMVLSAWISARNRSIPALRALSARGRRSWREAAMLPFVGHQDRNLGDGGVQVVAREPGHARDAAVIDGHDGFPLAVDEGEQ